MVTHDQQQVIHKTAPKNAGSLGSMTTTRHFQMQASEEQLAYIHHDVDENTKLLATAGSGKTFSVIHRMLQLTKRHPKNSIYMCTFSRAAAEDAQNKMRKEAPKSGMLKNISTIHSLAGKVLSKHTAATNSQQKQVNGLSLTIIRFKQFLEEWEITDDPETNKALGPLAHIKDLFVDEAQDLDMYQFKVIQLLQTKFGVRVHMIGDPNQCIYQFRHSSSDFLLKFDAKTFHLTKNYRSTHELVSFTNHLLVHPPSSEISTGRVPKEGETFNVPSVLHFSKQRLLEYLLGLFKRDNVNYSDYAILFPSKNSSGMYNVGASDVFDFLSLHDIPVKRYYSLTNIENQRGKKATENHISLHTYHSSKGLEYRHVIVVDCHHQLMNRIPTAGQYEEQRYLVYVALTRAKDEMDIIVHNKTGFNSSIKLFKAISDTPSKFYNIPDTLLKPKYEFKQENEVTPICTIVDILSHVPQDKLEKFTDIMSFTVLEQVPLNIKIDYHMEDYHNFRGIIVEEFIKHIYGLMYVKDYESPWTKKVKRELNSKAFSNTKQIKDMLEIQRRCGTWEALKTIKSRTDISKQLKASISVLETHLGSLEGDCELSNIVVLCHDDTRHQLYNRHILPHIKDASTIIKGSTIENPNLQMLGYLIIYYQLEELFGHFAEFPEIIKQVVDPIVEHHTQEIIEFVETHLGKPQSVIFDVPVKDRLSKINGLIDMVVDDTICEIKCTREPFTIEHLVQLWFYQFAKGTQDHTSSSKNNIVKLYNTNTGTLFRFKLEPKDPFELLNVLCDIGSMEICRLNLVYDLETNGLIRPYGPHRIPYPLQICGKEFNTGCTVIPEVLLKLPQHHTYDYDAGAIHHITQDMLEKDGKSMDQVTSMIKYRLRNCSIVVLWAHNGNRFDHQVVKEYEMFQGTSVAEYYDTIAAFRHFMKDPPVGYSIDKLCLHYGVNIEKIIPDPTKRHTAEADVDILLYLMKTCAKVKLF